MHLLKMGYMSFISVKMLATKTNKKSIYRVRIETGIENRAVDTAGEGEGGTN